MDCQHTWLQKMFVGIHRAWAEFIDHPIPVFFDLLELRLPYSNIKNVFGIHSIVANQIEVSWYNHINNMTGQGFCPTMKASALEAFLCYVEKQTSN